MKEPIHENYIRNPQTHVDQIIEENLEKNIETKQNALKNTVGEESKYIDEGNPNAGPAVNGTGDNSLPDHKDGGSPKDNHLAREIRRSIEADVAVAPLLRNVTLKVKDGNAFLTGMVFSQQAKMILADKASAIVGFGKVNNGIAVVEEMP